MDLKRVSKLLPERSENANKGTFGKVMVVAGSENYPGSAYLAGCGAYRVGAGLVTLAVPKIIYPILVKKFSEATFLVLEQVGEIEVIRDGLGNYNALVLGPGLGQSDRVQNLVKNILLLPNLPNTVLDADGLNILAGIKKWWEKFEFNGILTPHPGEMGRLTNLSVEEIQSDREKLAKEFSAKWNKVVVLKGAQTVIASPEGKVEILPFKNPALATAGTGDVLAGIIGGFLAQGRNLFDAAVLGGYVHGLAGEDLRKKMGDAGVVASDLLPVLPKIIMKLNKGKKF